MAYDNGEMVNGMNGRVYIDGELLEAYNRLNDEMIVNVDWGTPEMTTFFALANKGLAVALRRETLTGLKFKTTKAFRFQDYFAKLNARKGN